MTLTFLGHVSPLGVGELVLAHPDPPLHSRRDGLTRVGVEWREATQPAGGHTHTHILKVLASSPFHQPQLVSHDAKKKRVLLPQHKRYSQDVHDDAQGPHVT